MERYEIDEDRAFKFLVRMSSHGNVKLRKVAEEIVGGANKRNPDQARHRRDYGPSPGPAAGRTWVDIDSPRRSWPAGFDNFWRASSAPRFSRRSGRSTATLTSSSMT